MKKRNKTLKIVMILLLVLGLAGVAIFTAIKLNTQVAVAPTSPASEPKATVSCTGSGGACTAGTTCGTSRLITGTDCSSGYVCCSTGLTYDWSSSEFCMVSDITISDKITCDPNALPSSSKETIGEGESTIVTLKATENAKIFQVVAFNSETSKPVCYGTAASSTDCPNGGSPLTFVATDKTTMRLSSTITVTYAGLYVKDKTSNSVLDKVKLKAYFYDGSKWSNASDVCSIDISQTPLSSNLSVIKLAYEDLSNNTSGDYSFDNPIYTVSKNQQFVYGITVENKGEGDANGVKLTDTLKGNGLDNLEFVDKDSRCTWTPIDRVVSCSIDVATGEKETVGFRVKANDTIVNGSEITNAVKIESADQDAQNIKSTLKVSSFVGCNHTCTKDSECNSGLVCETTTGKCRNATCTSSESCSCQTATSTTPRVTSTLTTTPTATTEATLTPKDLPDSGIMDVPGAALFGGGVLMAVVGILLAL